MRTVVRTFAALGLCMSVTSCASHNPDVMRPTAGRLSVITRAEMEQTRYGSLFDVVQALRGRWLRSRGPNSLIGRSTEVQVLVDDMRMGGVETLRTMRTDNVVSIQFVDPVTAAQRWGGKHAIGTIVVTTYADGVP
ncbi:MAG: hypothetical protein V4813_16740 [Gemmatimonadota bacterium]